MVYNSLLEALSKLGGIKDWESIHVKVNLPGGKRHEIYFMNPDFVVEEVVEVKPPKPVVVEKLFDKIKRMRFDGPGKLSHEEIEWWKQRQMELENKKIGQILPEESMEVALEKLAQIGVKS